MRVEGTNGDCQSARIPSSFVAASGNRLPPIAANSLRLKHIPISHAQSIICNDFLSKPLIPREASRGEGLSSSYERTRTAKRIVGHPRTVNYDHRTAGLY